MKKLFSLYLICTLAVVAQKGLVKSTSPDNAAIQMWQQFDVNRINATINSAGPYADYLKIRSSGLEWPKGSGKTAVFAAGLWIVGRHVPSDSLRTAVMDYSTEFQPGPILSTFNTQTNDSSVAADPSDPKYRVYKINKGDNAGNNPDYAEWPGDLGAPFNDLNNNGIWDPGTDTPKLLGDQTLWSVINDVDPKNHRIAGTTPPMGFEVHSTYFGFGPETIFGDVMFMKFLVINKSDALYDSVYFSLWSDMDLGDANDDLAGCDTLLNLSFVYNNDNDDAGSSGYGPYPPAEGFAFLQGPLVTGNPDDIGFFDGKARSGYKNLSANSHVVYLGGGGGLGWHDPPLGNSKFPSIAHRYQQGYNVYAGEKFINPVTGNPTPFVFSGDPVSETGWHHKLTATTQDVRSMITSGPFVLAPADSQEIIAAYVIAGGVNRLHSVSLLKNSVHNVRAITRTGIRLPFATTSFFETSGMTATLRAQADCRNGSIDSITAIVKQTLTDSVVAIKEMIDDGLEGDSTAGDNIFFAQFTLPPTPTPYTLMYITTDSSGVKTEWQIAETYQFAPIDISSVSIISDHLNSNGIAERGEDIRFTIQIHNHNPFPLNNLFILPAAPPVRGTAVLSEIDAEGISETSSGSYFSLFIPPTYDKNIIALPFWIRDGNGNQWSVTTEIPVSIARKAERFRLSGKGVFEFDIYLSDTSAVKNHFYTVTAIDSLQTPAIASPFLVINDTTTGIMLSKTYLVDTTIASLHSGPVIDGFKIIPKKVVLNPGTKYIHTPDSSRWYSFTAAFDIFRKKSTIHFGDLPDITVRFAKKTGFIDSNSNGVFDYLERPVFDTTDIERMQKAYLYHKSSYLDTTTTYIGFRYVPFAVYDADANPPRKLTVAIIRRDTSEWLNFYKDTYGLHILSHTYQENGTQYQDSATGGFSIHKAIQSGAALPLYYSLGIYPLVGREIHKESVTTHIHYSHPFTSQDRFVFNPTILTFVRPPASKPSEFILEQNFPNPFNPSTTIRFSLPVRSKVTVSIYNVLGQRVATVVNEFKEPGEYSALWNGRNEQGLPVASGMYIYHIAAGEYTAAKKMMLLK
ncbi:MAG: T9SS type A sorting domain-containing protein [Bacteroidota bacterium]